jgi:hypothetical protein
MILTMASRVEFKGLPPTRYWTAALLALVLVFGQTTSRGQQGILATSVSIGDPDGLVFDRSGNLYIATNECVFKVGKQGVITWIAGTGVMGDSDDGTPVLKARITSGFADLALDSAGKPYLSNPFVHRIRKISVGGVITTVAGTGVAGSSADGGPATAAQIDTPHGIAIDSGGNAYFSDKKNPHSQGIPKRNHRHLCVGVESSNAKANRANTTPYLPSIYRSTNICSPNT